MTKFLVTTDFSAHSRRGIRFAFQFALQTQAEITLFHVLDLFDPDLAFDSATATPQLRWTKAIQLKTDQLKKFLHAVFPKGIPDVPYNVVCHKLERTLAQTIINYTKTHNFSMVFCSENGASLFKKVLGSLPEALLNNCPVPLCIVPKQYTTSPLHSLCYTTDMQHIDDEMHWIENWRNLLNIPLKVLYFDYEINLQEHQKTLHQIATTYENKDVQFHYIKLIPQSTFKTLLQETLKVVDPSLVIGFRKQNRSIVNRMLFPGKTISLIMENNLPLLVVRKESE